MSTKRLACLCPTYKRPQLLQNALACFLSQDYDPALRRLFIIDDANQHHSEQDEHFDIISHDARFSSLPFKYNALAEMAFEWGADGLVIWEDDDIFLPWHLSQIAASLDMGTKYVRPDVVWSNYMQTKGTVIQEGATGRFHSSWAYDAKTFDLVGGYPTTGRLDFDQQMGGIMRTLDPTPPPLPDYFPSYVYRWGNGLYHGSQAGEGGYQSLWDMLGERPAPPQGKLIWAFDAETRMVYESIKKPA